MGVAVMTLKKSYGEDTAVSFLLFSFFLLIFYGMCQVRTNQLIHGGMGHDARSKLLAFAVQCN